MSQENIIETVEKDEFLNLVKIYNPKANLKKIGEAYDFAKEAHKGQKRLSGRGQFVHVLNVAYILTKLRLDTETLCAAFLHDVIEDTTIKKERIIEKFGNEVFLLIEGVTKMRSIKLKSEDENRAENIRKVLLATIKDVRVMLIKLADRLHNMRTLKYLDEDSRKAISRETLEIYVPIAYKLGMYRLKSELEDLSLRFLKPEIYQELKLRISKKKEERDHEIKAIVEKVKTVLADKNIDARIYGRAKNFYSIYKKMTKKGIPFEQIHDLYAIRIITPTKDDCYRALGAIHETWTPLKERFDDYISTPKPNMYQSIHTEVLMDKKPVEVQMRTLEMHHLAEEGIAAHWRYKETERDKKFDRRMAWLKQILEWKTSNSAKEFIEDLKIDVFKDEIFIMTPKGDPILLPEGATPIDFAFAVHTDIGNHCARAKVNNNIVPLDTELKSGDICEIITARNATASRNWLKFAKTSNAKSKIRQSLGIVIEAESKSYELENINISTMIEGLKPEKISLPKCCNPRYGREITGYRHKDGKVAIHSATCVNLIELDETRKVKLNWKKNEKSNIIRIKVEFIDRIGLFADLLGIFSRMKVNILEVHSKQTKHKIYLVFGINDLEALPDLIPQMKSVKNVIDVIVD